MIPKLPFGRTQYLSSRAIFGAAALGGVTQREADETLRTLLQFGINHIDTAASYGHSEERIGPWMKAHRADFFLASKTGERTYQQAREQLHRSLERLQVEQIDLLQLHCLIEESEWQVAMGPDGALQALVEAREEGLIRFIGVTGHGTQVGAMHARSLERFDFDSVLLPFNFPMMQNVQYAKDFEALMQTCRERNVAVQTIKSLARGAWGEAAHTHATWYQPLQEAGEIRAAVHWAMQREGIFLNTLGDIHLLPEMLRAIEECASSTSTVNTDEIAQLELTPLFV